MLEQLNKLFTVTLKLKPEIWLVIFVVAVVATFLVTLLVGMFTGELKKVTSVMKASVARPADAGKIIVKMPSTIVKRYKRARMTNTKPSDMVVEEVCVTNPYNRSLISKVWIATFVATVLCAAMAFVISPLAAQAQAAAAAAEASDAASINAQYIAPFIVLLVGSILTLVGALLGRSVYGGALKTFVQYVAVLDGDAKSAPAPAPAPVSQEQVIEPEQHIDEQVVQPMREYGGADEVVEPVTEYGAEEQVVSEPVYDEPVAEAAPPVIEVQNDEEDFRAQAREQAMAQMRAEQEAAEAARAAQEAAEAQARAQAEAQAAAEAQARAQAEAQARAQAEAQARAQAEAQAAQAAQAAEQSGSSSADDVIARIEQIDREGAPRETMREVATLLQRERAKPENKTPEQQRKLNEALSKLLKAMSAASKK